MELAYLIYQILFPLSIAFAAIYILMWHKHFDVNFTMIFTLIPIACLGYFFTSFTKTEEGAILAVKLSYIGGCFLQMFILLSILDLCRIRIHNRTRALLFLICAGLYSSVLTIGHGGHFYSSHSFEMIDGYGVLHREYGFMHMVFCWVLCVFFLAGLICIVYSWFKKKQVPKRILGLLIVTDLICLLSFFVGKRVFDNFDIIPLGYIVAEFVFLLIAYRINLYDVSDTVIDSMVQEHAIGYLSFDFKYRYLGSNETARELIPGLSELSVDSVLGNSNFEKTIRRFIDAFKKTSRMKNFIFKVDASSGDPNNDRFYNVNVNYLYDSYRKKGYIITFTDDTSNRKYIKLLDNYNDRLKNEVEAKTKHIIEMHDNLIMSLAMLVESRDNSTGGHVIRTRESVRILTEEIRKEGKLMLNDEFCNALIKAAPMHDLGKIAVDDAILRKPGSLTDEEFEIMKSHAAEGALIIHKILLNTDDDVFKTVAENVAHFHHERWDGSGYPDGLSGENIPLESRIMAIADVYDALVNNRFYKGAIGFNEANDIIMEGMGSHFDPALKSAYEKARPRFEEYYSRLKEM